MDSQEFLTWVWAGAIRERYVTWLQDSALDATYFSYAFDRAPVALVGYVQCMFPEVAKQ